jgi:hypothetical protein
VTGVAVYLLTSYPRVTAWAASWSVIIGGLSACQ